MSSITNYLTEHATIKILADATVTASIESGILAQILLTGEGNSVEEAIDDLGSIIVSLRYDLENLQAKIVQHSRNTAVRTVTDGATWPIAK